MVTEQDILIWKEKYGKIFRTSIGSLTIYYRNLTIGEFTNMPSVDNYLYVLKTCVLDPKSIDSFPAGANIIVDKILLGTGLLTEEDMLATIKAAKDRMNGEYGFWKASIKKAFPEYTLEKINNFSPPQFFDHVMLAEQVLGTKLIQLKGPGRNKKQQTPQEMNNPDPHGVMEKITKFAQVTELQKISAETASNDLLNHWNQIKGSKKNPPPPPPPLKKGG